MALGERVRVLIDVGGGNTREEVIQATKAGGRTTVTTADEIALIQEVSKAGAPVRTVRVGIHRVVAIIEEPKHRG